jgi:hypothetical protein
MLYVVTQLLQVKHLELQINLKHIRLVVTLLENLLLDLIQLSLLQPQLQLLQQILALHAVAIALQMGLIHIQEQIRTVRVLQALDITEFA